MSYCRFGDNDAYVLRTLQGLIYLACRLMREGDWYGTFVAVDENDMINHLLKHKDQGHRIPNHAFKRLRKESQKTL